MPLPLAFYVASVLPNSSPHAYAKKNQLLTELYPSPNVFIFIKVFLYYSVIYMTNIRTETKNIMEDKYAAYFK